MIVEINNEEFELSTKLGTTFKIEEKFRKPYLRVLGGIEDLTAKEQIDMLACGITGKEEIEKFKKAILEYGLGQLNDILEDFVDGLQYPGLSKEEIEEKKLAKVKKQKHMKEIGLIS